MHTKLKSLIILISSRIFKTFQDFSQLFQKMRNLPFPPRSFNDLINPITKPKKFVSPAPQNMEIRID